MALILDEAPRSYIDDPRMIAFLRWHTYGTAGSDVSPTWIGPYMPATRADDADLVSLARFSRDHYMIYLWFVTNHMDHRGRVLDIGCGTGQRTAMLRRYAHEVVGLDTEMEKVRFAASHNGADNVTYAHGHFPQDCSEFGKFDYAFMVEVLEHVDIPEQDAFVAAALDCLAPAGRLFISVPKDRAPKKMPPHIGLWWPDDFAQFVQRHQPQIVATHPMDLTLLRFLPEASVDDVIESEATGNHWFVVMKP